MMSTSISPGALTSSVSTSTLNKIAISKSCRNAISHDPSFTKKSKEEKMIIYNSVTETGMTSAKHSVDSTELSVQKYIAVDSGRPPNKFSSIQDNKSFLTSNDSKFLMTYDDKVCVESNKRQQPGELLSSHPITSNFESFTHQKHPRGMNAKRTCHHISPDNNRPPPNFERPFHQIHKTMERTYISRHNLVLERQLPNLIKNRSSSNQGSINFPQRDAGCTQQLSTASVVPWAGFEDARQAPGTALSQKFQNESENCAGLSILAMQTKSIPKIPTTTSQLTAQICSPTTSSAIANPIGHRIEMKEDSGLEMHNRSNRPPSFTTKSMNFMKKLISPARWGCDYCKVATFNTYEETRSHEASCIKRQQPSAESKTKPYTFQGVGTGKYIQHNMNKTKLYSSLVKEGNVVRKQSSSLRCCLLAMPEDKDCLSDRQCFVRSHCVELFRATEADVAARHSKGAQKLSVGQVGIRCMYCHSIPSRERAERSMCYPSSITRMYQTVADMQRFHFNFCPEIPDDVKAHFKALKTTRPRGVGSPQQYWILSAKKLCLIDTPHGIRFETDGPPSSQRQTFNLLPSINSASSHVINSSSSEANILLMLKNNHSQQQESVNTRVIPSKKEEVQGR